MARVTVCISGGVDSAVAALLLKQQGHDVSGLCFRALPEGTCDADWAATHQAAEAVCETIGIRLEVLDVSERFERDVIGAFVSGYAAGLTPNPCVACNPAIKWGVVLDHMRSEGSEFVATGHYARVEPAPGRTLLRRGVDTSKDQSYMLCRLTQEHLRHSMLPLGKYLKEDVRRIAAKNELPAAERDESQDICFVPDGDHGAFLGSRMDARPGPILSIDGDVLGEHAGLHNYTVGQRKGLGIAAEQRLFVIDKDAARDALIVGPREKARSSECALGDVNWVSIPGPLPGEAISGQIEVRYRTTPVEAELTVMNGAARARLATPAVCAPGQAAVLYDGDLLLCGGTIQPPHGQSNELEV